MKAKLKKAKQQFVYRQKLKNSGGLYVGVYLRGDEAMALQSAKVTTDKSYAEIISMALRRSLIEQAVPEKTPTTKAGDENEWEDIKL